MCTCYYNIVSNHSYVIIDTVIQSILIVIYSAARPPFTPVNVTTIVTSTTAIITFVVPTIAYTPEEHYIQYIGLQLQNEQKISSKIVGQNILSTINVEYSITLGGLEEDNTYNFSVVSVNCVGSVTTSTMNFTTLPSCKTYFCHCNIFYMFMHILL